MIHVRASWRRPAGRIASVVLGGLTLMAERSAIAQSIGTPKDTVARDTARADSVRTDSVRVVKNMHGMQAALYAIALAPSGLLPLIAEDSSPHSDTLAYWRDHLSLYATEGLASGRRGPILGASWTGSGSVELLLHGAFVEARVERFKLLSHVEYRTVRVGRLWHPLPPVAGGITIGYRSVRNLRAHEGVEVAFPFIAGRNDALLRFESAYVILNRQWTWNYRLQGERRLGRTPFSVGCNVEFKSWAIRNHGELSHGSFGLVLGTVFGRR